MLICGNRTAVNMRLNIHHVQKNCASIIFGIDSIKHQLILILFGIQHLEET